MGLFKSKKKLKLKQELENIGDGKLEADLIKKENKKLLILVGVSLITIVLIIFLIAILIMSLKSIKFSLFTFK